MSTDKQVFPLYYEAKNDKVRKRLGIKGGFYWAEAKNYPLPSPVVLLRLTMLATMKMTLKTCSRQFARC